MPDLDVYFYEAFEEERAALARCLPPGLRAGFTSRAAGETPEPAAPPASVISVRTQSAIPPGWSGGLRAILSRTTGYDTMRRYLDSVSEPVVCGYLPHYCARAVAEQALLLWLALLRKLPCQTAHFRSFNRDGITGRETAGKNLLVCGVGNIGSELCAVGRGLGMNVKGVDPVRKFADVEYTPLAEGIKWADIIVVSMNLTPFNGGLFNRRTLAGAKKGTVFVNVARGELSPCEELVALVADGTLGAVGLDVYNEEAELGAALRAGRRPDSAEAAAAFELAALENVIFTPHNAFNTAEAVERKARQSAQQLEAFFKTGRFLWPVPEK
ncbi:MAG: NAD(P)-dependent oxidoreductase [Elusimicrobiaceae bacterium]|nr:NAD(P)-dependent oxidoreductase [Elusimicrobiaceae bacterium]